MTCHYRTRDAQVSVSMYGDQILVSCPCGWDRNLGYFPYLAEVNTAFHEHQRQQT